MTVHNFAASLERSRQHESAGWWAEVYRRAFPTMQAMVSVRDDGWAQRGGIDRVITLECGRTVTVDEKVREKDYGDILLEYWSDFERRQPGWVCKPLACDFIAYAIAPSEKCYLLPVLLLRNAWRTKGKSWVGTYGKREAKNERHTTISCPVPIPELMGAIQGAMLIEWSAAA